MDSRSHIIFLLFSHKKLNQVSHRESQYREASAGHFHVLSFYRLFFGTQNILWSKNLVTVPSIVFSSTEILVPPNPGKFQVLEIIQSKQAKSSRSSVRAKSNKSVKKKLSDTKKALILDPMGFDTTEQIHELTLDSQWVNKPQTSSISRNKNIICWRKKFSSIYVNMWKPKTSPSRCEVSFSFVRAKCRLFAE